MSLNPRRRVPRSTGTVSPVADNIHHRTYSVKVTNADGCTASIHKPWFVAGCTAYGHLTIGYL